MGEQAQQNERECEWIDIVNAEDDVIAQASRSHMRVQRLRHRASFIVVHDGMGKILVQRRASGKDYLPDMLDATAGGVVLAGESMQASAKREVEEELGIADIPIAQHGKFYFENVNCRVWGGLFSCVFRGPFVTQPEEIAEVYWMTPEEITARCDEFTDDSLKALSLWLSRHKASQHTTVTRPPC